MVAGLGYDVPRRSECQECWTVRAQCILQRFWVLPAGNLRRDRATYVNTHTVASDGKIITMAPGR
ncbi:hypothetical protein HH308_17805 [Gordonia sp. TBRC 11910]|uniref:Uncharacterized protein n=1 Tax=Gordonia asplenii TaxID=2725283 RepID=A0A848KXV6_9ACTN|nr:hypothetical protein [Gordonia asplenii]NMO03072.1 hypothetical protein [Gordonia asplenii]